MTHLAVAVFVDYDNRESVIIKQIKSQLDPYKDKGEWFATGPCWDWWVIGGRWDGEIMGLEWLNLKEPCLVCNASGMQPETDEQFGNTGVETTYRCNICKGTGKSYVWPTDERYSTLKRNYIKAYAVSPEFTPAVFITPDGRWHEKDRMESWEMTLPEKEEEYSIAEDIWEMKWKKALNKFSTYGVVLVDCHT